MRLAAIMDLPIIYVFTHDSIAVGEDGPTHQPVEQVTMLRSIPNFTVIRPADANETKAAWEIALNSKTTPTALLLTRQDVPMLTTASEASKVKFGGYIKALEKEKLDGIIIASGSEVSLALEAKEELYSLGIDVRVVSMPSINLFEKQSSLYQESILPKSILTKVAIEMSDATHYYKYVGTSGSLINIQRFGMSSPYQTLVSNYGFNLENIVSEFLITYNKNK
jgi:transketolase